MAHNFCYRTGIDRASGPDWTCFKVTSGRQESWPTRTDTTVTINKIVQLHNEAELDREATRAVNELLRPYR